MLDSTDRKSGKQSTSRSSDTWSYKENGPAQRFTFLMDYKRRIRKVWGGYTPKLYDGHFLQERKWWFEGKLQSAGVTMSGAQAT